MRADLVLRVCRKGGEGKSSLRLPQGPWAAGCWPGMSLTCDHSGWVMFTLR